MSANPTSHQQNVLAVKTPLCVTVVRKSARLSDIINLSPGQIIRFDKRCTDDLTLETNGQTIARVSPVIVGDQIGVRVRS